MIIKPFKNNDIVQIKSTNQTVQIVRKFSINSLGLTEYLVKDLAGNILGAVVAENDLIFTREAYEKKE